MVRGLFPSAGILRELESTGKLESVFDTLGQIVNAETAQTFGSTSQNSGNAEMICLGYLRAYANGQLSDISVSPKLRRAVYNAVFNFKMVRNAAVETLWDVIQVFGLKNMRATVRYLDSAPPMSAQKLKRLLVQLAQHETILDPDVSIEQERAAMQRACLGLAVILASSMAQQFDSEWKRDVRTSTVVGRALFAAANKYAVTSDQKALLTMFPQMSLARARKLLESGQETVEEITQKLLDDPQLMDNNAPTNPNAPKKRFVKYKRDPHSGHREADPSLVNKTLELVQAMYDDMDEPDDEPATSELDHAVMRLPGEPRSDVSAADQRVAHRQERLHELFIANPDDFTKHARKTKQRQALKRELEWTDEQIEGFATMMMRDPRLRERVQWEDRLANRMQQQKSKSAAPKTLSEISSSTKPVPMVTLKPNRTSK